MEEGKNVSHNCCNCERCLAGCYNPLDYTISEEEFNKLDSPRPLGITGHLRVKNEGLTLSQCIDSCIEFLDELIITYNDSEDNTEEILFEYEKKYSHKIRIYHYKPKVYVSSDYKEFPELWEVNQSHSVHNLVNYYNYGYVKTSYKYYMKIDADQIYFTDKMLKLRDKLVNTQCLFDSKLSIDRYIKTYKEDIRNFGLVLGGINVVSVKKECTVPLRGRNTFNGCGGDHVLWIPNAQRRYVRDEKFFYETIVTCFKPKFYGFAWLHLGPVKRVLTQGAEINVPEIYQMGISEVIKLSWLQLVSNKNFRYQHLKFLRNFLNPKRIFHYISIGKWWNIDRSHVVNLINKGYLDEILKSNSMFKNG